MSDAQRKDTDPQKKKSSSSEDEPPENSPSHSELSEPAAAPAAAPAAKMAPETAAETATQTAAEKHEAPVGHDDDDDNRMDVDEAKQISVFEGRAKSDEKKPSTDTSEAPLTPDSSELMAIIEADREAEKAKRLLEMKDLPERASSAPIVGWPPFGDANVTPMETSNFSTPTEMTGGSEDSVFTEGSGNMVPIRKVGRRTIYRFKTEEELKRSGAPADVKPGPSSVQRQHSVPLEKETKLKRSALKPLDIPQRPMPTPSVARDSQNPLHADADVTHTEKTAPPTVSDDTTAKQTHEQEEEVKRSHSTQVAAKVKGDEYRYLLKPSSLGDLRKGEETQTLPVARLEHRDYHTATINLPLALSQAARDAQRKNVLAGLSITGIGDSPDTPSPDEATSTSTNGRAGDISSSLSEIDQCEEQAYKLPVKGQRRYSSSDESETKDDEKRPLLKLTKTTSRLSDRRKPLPNVPISRLEHQEHHKEMSSIPSAPSAPAASGQETLVPPGPSTTEVGGDGTNAPEEVPADPSTGRAADKSSGQEKGDKSKQRTTKLREKSEERCYSTQEDGNKIKDDKKRSLSKPLSTGCLSEKKKLKETPILPVAHLEHHKGIWSIPSALTAPTASGQEKIVPPGPSTTEVGGRGTSTPAEVAAGPSTSSAADKSSGQKKVVKSEQLMAKQKVKIEEHADSAPEGKDKVGDDKTPPFRKPSSIEELFDRTKMRITPFPHLKHQEHHKAMWNIPSAVSISRASAQGKPDPTAPSTSEVTNAPEDVPADAATGEGGDSSSSDESDTTPITQIEEMECSDSTLDELEDDDETKS